MSIYNNMYRVRLCILYFTNHKVFWLLSFEVLKIKFDVSHLGIYVTIRNDSLGATDKLLPIINTI